MHLNDLLTAKGCDLQQVLVFRHRPHEPALNRVLPWLAAERHELFNAYQQAQREKVEKAMTTARYVASFIGHAAGKAVFVGLYEIKGSTRISRKQYWNKPENIELHALGMSGFTDDDPRDSLLWFDLALTDFHRDWQGKLVVGWPPPERSWWRRAQNNVMPVRAIHEQSIFEEAMPTWTALNLSWDELRVIPQKWKAALQEWRGIYYIFDTCDGKGYVGSAYGKTNILGRWENYAATGHGGNRLLLKRDPQHFQFTILERLSPDLDDASVTQIESSWKERLHTRQPWGLNDN